MAKILYGVSGEGSGHSSRAREMLDFLVARGHDVKVVSYDRGYRNLSRDFEVVPIAGLTIAAEENQVSLWKTFTENIGRIPEAAGAFKRLKQIFKAHEPDCAITDFEPMTAYLANHYSVPLVSIDNQHRMRYMEYTCPKRFTRDRIITETVIKAMVPKPDVCLVTSFHTGRIKNDFTFLFPPILRKSVLALNPAAGDHVLVYVTKSYDGLMEKLKTFDREEFIVYGYDMNERDGNLVFRKPSGEGFLQDLAACKAVIATAGFTLMTEALYLQKPYFALPMQGQFEQVLNGLFLQKLAYGKTSMSVTREQIAAFLYNLPQFCQNLSRYERCGNEKIQLKLESLLADDCALVKRFQQDKDKE